MTSTIGDLDVDPQSTEEMQTGWELNGVTSEQFPNVHPRTKHLLDAKYWPQRSKGWLNDRLHRFIVTGTTCGPICGEGYYGNGPETVFKDKCALREPFVGSSFTDYGQKHEPDAIAMYEREYKVKVFEVGVVAHPKLDFVGASPDGIREDGMPIEVKCPVTREITDRVPEHYISQCQLVMHVLDAVEMHFVEYQPPKDIINHRGEAVVIPAVLSVKTIKRDPTWFSARENAFALFKARVDKYRAEDPKWEMRHHAWRQYAQDVRDAGQGNKHHVELPKIVAEHLHVDPFADRLDEKMSPEEQKKLERKRKKEREDESFRKIYATTSKLTWCRAPTGILDDFDD